MTQPPRIALKWNRPICFFLCANMSDRVKIRTGLSDSEAVAWSHTVSTIPCHVHMLEWVYPHFQLSCDDSHENTERFWSKEWNTTQILYLLVICVTRWSKIFPFWIFMFLSTTSMKVWIKVWCSTLTAESKWRFTFDLSEDQINSVNMSYFSD